MVDQRSKELIIEYIVELDGKATINGVAKHMREVEEPYTLAKDTVKGVIRDFEKNGRIIIQRGKPGRPHYLKVVGECWYDRLSEQIENIQLFLKEHPDYRDRALNLLLWNLARINKYIKNENERLELNQRMINALLKVRYNKDDLALTV